jgi:hypothetical protein
MEAISVKDVVNFTKHLLAPCLADWLARGTYIVVGGDHWSIVDLGEDIGPIIEPEVGPAVPHLTSKTNRLKLPSKHEPQMTETRTAFVYETDGLHRLGENSFLDTIAARLRDSQCLPISLRCAFALAYCKHIVCLVSGVEGVWWPHIQAEGSICSQDPLQPRCDDSGVRLRQRFTPPGMPTRVELTAHSRSTISLTKRCPRNSPVVQGKR